MSSLNPIDIVIILDKSGSMNVMGEEPVQALNAFVTEQQKEAGDANLFFYVFSHEVTEEYTGPIKDAESYTYAKYSPNGMTALYDAIGQSIAERNSKNGVLMIITDGEDNASQKYDLKDSREMIEKLQTDGWHVSYIGANQDAFKEGNKLGVRSGACLPFNTQTKGELAQIFRSTSQTVSCMRSGKPSCPTTPPNSRRSLTVPPHAPSRPTLLRQYAHDTVPRFSLGD